MQKIMLTECWLGLIKGNLVGVKEIKSIKCWRKPDLQIGLIAFEQLTNSLAKFIICQFWWTQTSMMRGDINLVRKQPHKKRFDIKGILKGGGAEAEEVNPLKKWQPLDQTT